MSTVVIDMSMSLDGFVTGPRRTPEQPLGDGGEQLHAWVASDDPDDRAMLSPDGLGGAFVCGWNTYADSLPWWGADGPSGEHRIPLFVLTHRTGERPAPGSVYTFVTDGLADAVARARAAAGTRPVGVSGADVSQQLLRAGLADEVTVHVAPVLLGDGIRLFDALGDHQVGLEQIHAVSTPAATHLRFRVRR